MLIGYMAFLPLAKTHPLCFWQFGFIAEFDKNTAAMFLLVVKMAASHLILLFATLFN